MLRYKESMLLFIIMLGVSVTAANLYGQQDASKHQMMSAQSKSVYHPGFYDFRVKTLSGEDFDLIDLKGKRVLIVNTASECGNTPQYAQLQELYEKYGGDKFVIIGFPSNDFGAQEPGSNSEIAEFCTKNYGVTFPMMAKISVKGDEIHPLYKWLTQQELNGRGDAEVTWNFDKFLIDETGRWITHFAAKVQPLDERIVTFAKGMH